jgi:predicted RNA-binding Zn ribbon-like protein
VRLLNSGEVARTGDQTSVLSTIAKATVELLGEPRADQFKVCGAHDCTRLHLDTSRRGDRR